MKDYLFTDTVLFAAVRALAYPFAMLRTAALTDKK
jgi:hypothetical protein